MKIQILMTNDEVEALCEETGMSVRLMEGCFESRLLNVAYSTKEGDLKYFQPCCSVEIVTA